MAGEIETVESKEQARDNDLNAIEAWALGSSHTSILIEGEAVEGTQQILERIFKTNRKKVLVPENVRNGVRTIEEENAIRVQKPYTDGYLALFGSQYMFGYDHKINLGVLSPDGMPFQISVIVLKDNQPVDPKTLGLDPSFTEFFEEPKPTDDGWVTLQIK